MNTERQMIKHRWSSLRITVQKSVQVTAEEQVYVYLTFFSVTLQPSVSLISLRRVPKKSDSLNYEWVFVFFIVCKLKNRFSSKADTDDQSDSRRPIQVSTDDQSDPNKTALTVKTEEQCKRE